MYTNCLQLVPAWKKLCILSSVSSAVYVSSAVNTLSEGSAPKEMQSVVDELINDISNDFRSNCSTSLVPLHFTIV